MSVSMEEATFVTGDGQKLYSKIWKPSSASYIHLIFIHGFSDHINAYYNLFPTLASTPYNITIHGFDQRGWGRSVTERSKWGITGDTNQVLSDINDFTEHVSSSINDSASKLFLMGHSMGGAESLMYLLSNDNSFKSRSRISGLLVESPHIGFPADSKPNPLVVFAGRLASKVLPHMQMVQKLDPSAMSRDPKVCKDWADDPLCHDTGTLQGLAGLLDRAHHLNTFGGSRALPCPVWWAHGSGDKVCDFEASRTLYGKLVPNYDDTRSKELSQFRDYEGGYHKLHGEPDGVGEQFAKEAGDWILQVAGVSQQSSQSSQGQVTASGTEGAGEDEAGVRSKL